jgi:integrase
VPMNFTVQKVLAELKTSQNTLSGGRVFLHDSRYLRRAFDRAVKAAGLSPFRFHDLRHAFASRLAMSGCNDRGIMELGGWSSSPMLKRYVDISPAHLWQAVEGLTQNGNGSKTGVGLMLQWG